jgi:ankyrin repeat protein
MNLSIVGLAAKSTPLHCASSKGHTEVAKLLIEKGISFLEISEKKE